MPEPWDFSRWVYGLNFTTSNDLVWPAWQTQTTGFATYDLVWPAWQTQTGFATNDLVWPAWQTVGTSNPTYTLPAWANDLGPAPVRTPAEIRREEAAERRRIRAYELTSRRREREEENANRRAERLLLQHLTPEQREEYKRLERFHVLGPDGRKYRIRRGWAGNVQLVEESPDEGELLVEQWCVHPRETVPLQDNMLAQKLMLESDPSALRRIANVSLLRRSA